jgi:hypothetical protein
VGPTRQWLEGGRLGAHESFRIIIPAWCGALDCHIGQNSKYVAKTSLRWQFCKLNSKSDF